MNHADRSSLSATIERAFDERDTINTATRGEVRDAVNDALNLLDSGKARVAERGEDGVWTVNQWLKKAVLLSFRLNPMEIVKGGPGDVAGCHTLNGNLQGRRGNQGFQDHIAQRPFVLDAGDDGHGLEGRTVVAQAPESQVEHGHQCQGHQKAEDQD